MEEKRKAVVALGTFDGVHLGHRALIERTVALAAERNAVPAVYTFANHPASVLGGNVRLLSTQAERRALLLALGVQDVQMAPFTKTLAALSPEAFVGKLFDRWAVAGAVVGFNYTFGARGSGTPETLRALGVESGFSVHVIAPVRYGDGPVSSTRIREALERGDAADAAAMLGRPYALSGDAAACRTAGFCTVRLDVPLDRVLPAPGVYVTEATFAGERHRAVTRVGADGAARTVETRLTGFDGDARGKTLAVSFLARLRENREFDTEEALRSALMQDAAAAEAYGNTIGHRNENPDKT